MAITNAGSIVADQSVALKIDADATVGFTNTGTVSVTGSGGLQILSSAMNQSGTVTIASGTTLARTGNYTQTGGSTQVDGALSVTSGVVDLQGGVLRGNGQVSGSVTNAATVAPGVSPGTLTVSGAFTQPMAGVLSIEIDGLTPGTQHDVLAVTGAATLEGEVQFVFGGTYAPTVGDQAVILTAGSITGDFARISYVNPPAGFFAYDVVRVGNTMVFKVLDPTGVPTPDASGVGVAAAHKPLAIRPNPSIGGQATLSFQVASPGAEIDLAIYDAAGRRVRTLLAGWPGTSERRVAWDGLDDSGRAVASGAYFARLAMSAWPDEVRRLTVVR
jgi:hypothetical protein